MGHFSLHCCLSGIPIRDGAPVVGWHLQKTKFRDASSDQWIPVSFPVVGFYDGYGRVADNADESLTEDAGYLAMCHRDLWDTLPEYWDPQDGEELMQQAVENAHRRFLDNRKTSLAMPFRETPYWDAYRGLGTDRNSLMWLHKMCIGEPAESDGKANEETKDWGYERHCGPFEKLLLDLVIAGPKYLDFRETCDNLEKLLGAYTTTVYRGKPIIPTEATHALQDTDYKIEKKWFNSVNKKINELRKEELEQERLNKIEEEQWEAEEAKKTQGK